MTRYPFQELRSAFTSRAMCQEGYKYPAYFQRFADAEYHVEFASQTTVRLRFTS